MRAAYLIGAMAAVLAARTGIAGTFGEPVEAPIDRVARGVLGIGSSLPGMRVADLDADGTAEIIAVTARGGIIISKTEALVFETQLDGAARVAVADFDGDGRLDLAVLAGNPSRIAIYTGRRDGFFSQAPGLVVALPPANSTEMEAGDFNHDGLADLVVQRYLLIARRPLGFTLTEIGQDAISSPPAVADIDGDGNLDVAFGTFVGYGDGAGGFSPFSWIGPRTVFAAFADFNGDGILDCAFANPPVSALVLTPRDVEMGVALGLGSRRFGERRLFRGPGGAMALADLDRDGKMDLVAASSVFRGRGDGGFDPPVYLAEPEAPCRVRAPGCGLIGVPFVADMNGDGVPDIVVGYFTGEGSPIWIYHGTPRDGLAIAGISAADGRQVVASGSIASAYGEDLAWGTEGPFSPPCPESAGGIRVLLEGSPAKLVYVSPTQIDYIVPGDVYDNYTGRNVELKIEGQPGGAVRGTGPRITGTAAPGFFTSGPGGLAAATAERVAPDGTRTPVPVLDCSSGTCEPVAIDTSGDPVAVSLYGTGFLARYSSGRFQYNLPPNSASQGQDILVLCDGIRGAAPGPQVESPGVVRVPLVAPRVQRETDFAIECTVSQAGPLTYSVKTNRVYVRLK